MSSTDRFRLDGRTALITGASSGIGARFAEVAAAQGASVVLVARRIEKLEALERSITDAGGRATIAVADVKDAIAVARAFDVAEEHFGVVDLFVANAGISLFETPLEVTPESWRNVMSSNLDAVFFSCQLAAQRMIANNRTGSMITVASVAGLRVPGRLASYGIAKAAVIQATRQLALELGPKGIRVNGIAPGWILTEMSADYLGSDDGQKYTSENPLGRYGTVEDLDGLFLLLASDAGSYITGQTIAIDAGQLLRG